eukprot:INCI3491.1.p1 GENE.INCI3491.1~~INCI3491.1.p1  ORF type:complete len:212 (+),score=26.43 INCI3491.1:152-787(+)
MKQVQRYFFVFADLVFFEADPDDAAARVRVLTAVVLRFVGVLRLGAAFLTSMADLAFFFAPPAPAPVNAWSACSTASSMLSSRRSLNGRFIPSSDRTTDPSASRTSKVPRRGRSSKSFTETVTDASCSATRSANFLADRLNTPQLLQASITIVGPLVAAVDSAVFSACALVLFFARGMLIKFCVADGWCLRLRSFGSRVPCFLGAARQQIL